jgi:hypothetical protein
MTQPQDAAQQGPEWIERVRQGDEAAFESLFRAFAPGVCAFLARYVDSRAVDEEDPDPAKRDQYARWRELRRHQQAQTLDDTTTARRSR